ncbi:MAG: hypothetical protein ACRDDX_03040 [Cellulosilyticaceae bacterium]
MLINKLANKQVVEVGDRVTYTLQVINNDAFTINNVNIADTLPPELKLVDGSLYVNGSIYPGNLGSGIPIGTIPGGGMASIRFEADVLQKGDGTITNIATGNYSYQTEGMLYPQCKTVTSEGAALVVMESALSITKASSKTAVKLGDVFYFTITITNQGDVDVSNLLVKDMLNPALVLMPETLTMNNQLVVNGDITQGIGIPSLTSGSSAIISFGVKVIGGSVSGCIGNIATVTGNYAQGSNCTVTKMWESNVVKIYIGVASFKQIILDSSFSVPSQKPDIEDITGINASVEILDSYVVPTASGVSNEGQILTGNKAVVNGVIKAMVTYTGLTITQDTYAVYCEIPFGAFVVLPVDYREGYRVEVIGTIEKASYSMIDARNFYINIALILKAMVLV